MLCNMAYRSCHRDQLNGTYMLNVTNDGRSKVQGIVKMDKQGSRQQNYTSCLANKN